MGNIDSHIPKDSLTVTRIFEEYKKEGDSEPARGYLGASIIGHHCERYLWYNFRQCCTPDFSGRLYRLFETGDREEMRMIENLRKIGCEVHDTDASGGQFEVTEFGGHFSGHMDGCILGLPEAPKTWHVFEGKTHNAKSFTELKQNEVQVSKPQHFGQMQSYMHLTGMKRALYLGENKDTDELYSKRINYDKEYCEGLMAKAKRVITSNEPPPRPYNRSDYYLCEWCDAKSICWGSNESSLPVKTLSCRQCCHATPDIEGEGANWHCEKKKEASTGNESVNECFERIWTEEEPCSSHLCLPSLFHFASPTDYVVDGGGNESIEFTNGLGGMKWRHGEADECYSSEELMVISPGVLHTGVVVSKAKELFGAVVKGESDTILARYPEEESHVVWKGLESGLFDEWKELYNEDLTQLEMLDSSNFPDYRAAELPGDRVAIVWCDGTAEIRKGKE